MLPLAIPLAAAPAVVLQWIAANPSQTALILVNGVILLTAPLLALMGWGALGPRAGTAAAWLQATLAPIGGGSLFSVAQSAAMGGYGVGIVNGIAQGAAAVSAAAPYLVRAGAAWWFGKLV
ncbi:MAG: hypothetical protein M1829_006149 [Trizodia sp. TS-e1964]|nr:MAG: hypothetical protein M1829_006149 [Trizodia sp. TS-e1964]